MNLEFHPAVQRDVNEITAYYEREASTALAERFFTALLAQLERVAAPPRVTLPTRQPRAISGPSFRGSRT